MIYKLAPHVTVQMLNECGFVENAQGDDVPIVVDESGQWCAVRVHGKVYLEINHILHPWGWHTWIACSKGQGKDNRKAYIKPYIQDLIDKGMVICE
jgi:hypothetical protein